jgi:hypothetical protein
LAYFNSLTYGAKGKVWTAMKRVQQRRDAENAQAERTIDSVVAHGSGDISRRAFKIESVAKNGQNAALPRIE